ncbi:hypothetical protein J2T50_001365 [Streptococcus gallinaceus]|uniref:hypothetical protein n=1 Tax=Streptococcus gallinaceus TaxID=165758 RepID=UPI002646BBAF|nr:hypothetical protein [Streptococcus gallinaceus]MCP1639665.1 hypothetical protein [Streptococcus gallinaceus]MCP1770448.1 hypothetical protein [Streptococcus gallinaceus]
MIVITSTMAKAVRRKMADEQLTAQQASKAIGINPITLKKICNAGTVKNSVFVKVSEWLATDY